MNAESTRALVTGGISDYSTEMVTIAGAVVIVIVGFFVLRKGLDYLRSMVDERGEFGDVPNRSKGEKWGVPS